MEFVYYFIGSLFGATVVLLLGFILLRLKNIETILASSTTKSKKINQYNQRLREGIKNDE